jgi:hypothetical protein
MHITAVVALNQIKPQIPELDPENEEFCVFTRTTGGVSRAGEQGAGAATQAPQSGAWADSQCSVHVTARISSS